jgi:hypothetical protein
MIAVTYQHRSGFRPRAATHSLYLYNAIPLNAHKAPAGNFTTGYQSADTYHDILNEINILAFFLHPGARMCFVDFLFREKRYEKRFMMLIAGVEPALLLTENRRVPHIVALRIGHLACFLLPVTPLIEEEVESSRDQNVAARHRAL